MYDQRAPSLAVVEEGRKTVCNEKVLNDMREDAKKTRAPLPRNESGSFNHAVTPISPVWVCSNFLSRPHYTQIFLLVTIASQSSPI